MKIWYVYSPRWKEEVYLFHAKVLDGRISWNPQVFLGKGKVTTDGIAFSAVEINEARWKIDDRARLFKKRSEALKEVASLVKCNAAFDGPYHYHIPVMSSGPTRLD